MDILNIPLGYVMRFCDFLMPSYAFSLLLFALLMKILLFPLGIKQQKAQIKQANLRPKEMAIRKRYAGRDDKVTQQKMQQEIMDLYQKENYNPVGGCLPLLLQFPIIIALYNVIRNPLTYICRFSADTVTAIKDALVNLGVFAYDAEKAVYSIVSTGASINKGSELEMMQYIRSNFDAIKSAFPDGFDISRLPNFHLFGDKFDLSLVPNAVMGEQWWILAIPILTFVFSFFSMKLTRKFTYQPPTDDSQPNGALSMKIMDLTMPLFSVFITFSLPAVIGVYWIYQNILGVVQQYVLSRMYPVPVFTDEDYKKAEKEMNGSVRREKKKEPVHSLHHIDDEEEKETKKEQPVDRPALKESRDGSLPPPKQPGDKPKVRSLHHIDDEDNVPDEKPGKSGDKPAGGGSNGKA